MLKHLRKIHLWVGIGKLWGILMKYYWVILIDGPVSQPWRYNYIIIIIVVLFTRRRSMRNLNRALCLGYSLRPKAECCSQVQGHSFFFAYCKEPKLFQLICFYAMLSMAWKKFWTMVCIVEFWNGYKSTISQSDTRSQDSLCSQSLHEVETQVFVMMNFWAFKS